MAEPQHPTFPPPVPDDRETRFLRDLLRGETLGGVLALAAALVAVVWANSRWSDSYVEAPAPVPRPARRRALGG